MDVRSDLTQLYVLQLPLNSILVVIIISRYLFIIICNLMLFIFYTKINNWQHAIWVSKFIAQHKYIEKSDMMIALIGSLSGNKDNFSSVQRPRWFTLDLEVGRACVLGHNGVSFFLMEHSKKDAANLVQIWILGYILANATSPGLTPIHNT